MKPETATDLSIIIVSWNTCKLLQDCLESVYADPESAAIEVWVVDNASSDNSVAMLKERFPHVKLIANTENVGFARANNQAARLAAGRYLLLLNSDTVVPIGALPALVQAMESRPEVGVSSPLLLNADGSPQFCWARFPDWRFAIVGSLDISQSPYALPDFADATKRRAMEPFLVDWVGGACFLVRRSTLSAVGLLDEDYFMYFEETDWCVRFRAAGAKVMLVPAVTVTHLGGGSSRAVPAKTRERMYRSSLRFYRKTYGLVGSLVPSAASMLRYALFRMFKLRGK